MTDRNIIEVIRTLLNRIGIISSFYVKKEIKKYKLCYEVAIQKRDMQKLFLRKVGFSIKRKQGILHEFCSDEILMRNDNPKHPWFRKREIEFLKRNYPKMNTKNFVKEMNVYFWKGKDIRTPEGIYSKASELGIRKEMNI